MALVTRVCECGNAWDDLVGVVAGPDRTTCPECGEESRRTLPGTIATVFCGTEHMSAGDLQLGRENKRAIEKEADRLRSGEIRINQSGRVPLELRPEIPKTVF